MTDQYSISPRDLKHYPHFDAPISISAAQKLVSDPDRVAANAFFPFILYHDTWMPYRTADVVKPEVKCRPIRYGARRDAYIFLHYRRKLAEQYETRLRTLGISQCPIAYRQIPKASGVGGKCNIDFAKDAFDYVDQLGNCVAIALDIKSYFENLDHSYVKRIWCELLGVGELPPDHYAVYKNITRYRYVDQRDVYRRLGYFGPVDRNGRKVEGFLVPFKDVPTQLCSPADFRAKVCGGNPEYPSLIRKNTSDFGVPQGAPISDLIANLYLLEFDRMMQGYATQRDGLYLRYSDDILIVLPGNRAVANPAIQFATDEIQKYGSRLAIKDSKTCVVEFQQQKNRLSYCHIRQYPNEPGKNGLEYLGFRYDGRKVYVRDSTVSGFYRKVAAAARIEGARHVSNNSTLDVLTLLESFNFSLFSQRFSRVKRVDLTSDYKTWTFHSYLKRAATTFGPKGDRILRQARGFKNFMRTRIEQAIARAAKRD